MGALLIVGAVYVLCAGPGRAAVRFAVAHLVPTVLALVAILAGGALASGTADHLYATTDVGISAGLAGIGGALAVFAWWRGHRALGVALFAGLVLLFTYALPYERLSAVLADREHLAALVIAAVVELRRPVSSRPAAAIPIGAAP
jgi:hypothetical protein